MESEHAAPQGLGNQITAAWHVRGLIEALGEDPCRPGLRDTPARVVRAYAEMMAGYEMNPAEILGVKFSIRGRDMVLLRRASFRSLCEHHMLPFTGSISIGYVPERDEVVGLSKLARLVDCFALRLQIQERLTYQICEALNEHVTKNAAVVVRAKHHCMCHRGVRKDAEMVTSRVTGCFVQPEPRAEFMAMA